MGRRVTRVMHQWSARQQDADPKPVSGWDKHRCGGFGAKRVEQPGDIGVRRNDPTRSPSNRSCAPYAQKAIADREARLKAALANCIVAICINYPSKIGGRL